MPSLAPTDPITSAPTAATVSPSVAPTDATAAPTASAAAPLYLLNVAGSGLVDGLGRSWSADSAFVAPAGPTSPHACVSAGTHHAASRRQSACVLGGRCRQRVTFARVPGEASRCAVVADADRPSRVAPSQTYRFWTVSATAPTYVYQLPLSSGSYRVTLLFANLFTGKSGGQAGARA
jgi:hypothetical protein